MADGLSVAASVAGLVSLAGDLVKITYKYVRTVKHAQEEVRSLSTQVSGLYGVLCAVQVVADQLEDGSSGLQACRVEHIYQCQRLLESVKDSLEGHDGTNQRGTYLEKARKSLKWPFNKTQTKQWIDELHDWKSTMSLALSADSLNSLLQLLSRQETIVLEVRGIRENLEKAEKAQLTEAQASERKRILNTFLVHESAKVFSLSRSLRCSGTGNWLLDLQEFQKWLAEPGSVLWFYGIPGAGKTILASIVVSELQKALNRSCGLAFYFCTYRSKASQDPRRILLDLARQLAQQNELAFNSLKTYCYSSEGPDEDRHLTSSPIFEIENLLVEMLKPFKTVSLVLDGLDECDNSTCMILSSLTRVHKKGNRIARMLIFSREEQSIRHALLPYASVSVAATSADLRLFVRAEVEQRIQQGQLYIRDADLKDDMIKRLTNEADGMFRWVTCQIDHLCELPTDATRRAALDTLPPNLEETYNRILQRVSTRPHAARTLVKRVLDLLSYEPSNERGYLWHIQAIREAVSLEDWHTHLHRDAIPSEEEILRSCSSLVRVTDSKQLIFAHFTVKEYLNHIDKIQEPFLAAYYHIADQTRVGVEGCKLCLRYLLLEDSNYYNTGKSTNQLPERFVFAKDAIRLLYLEAVEGRIEQDSELERLVYTYVKGATIRSWAHLWVTYKYSMDWSILKFRPSWQPDRSGCSEVESITPMHWAAIMRLPKLIEKLANEGYDVDATSLIGSPLAYVMFRPDMHDIFGTWFFKHQILGIGGLAGEGLACIVKLLHLGANINYTSLPGCADGRDMLVVERNWDYGVWLAQRGCRLSPATVHLLCQCVIADVARAEVNGDDNETLSLLSGPIAFLNAMETNGLQSNAVAFERGMILRKKLVEARADLVHDAKPAGRLYARLSRLTKNWQWNYDDICGMERDAPGSCNYPWDQKSWTTRPLCEAYEADWPQ